VTLASGQARWKPGEITGTQVHIATDSGRDTWLTVPNPGLRPTAAMFAGSDWHRFPGAEWEETGGEWVIAVFCLPAQASR